MLKMIDEEDARRERGSKSGEEEQNEKTSSSSSSGKSDAKAPRRNMGQKRMNAPPCNIDTKILDRFKSKFPELSLTGKASEYYKCQDVLDIIKETADKTYTDLEDFERKLVKCLNDVH